MHFYTKGQNQLPPTVEKQKNSRQKCIFIQKVRSRCAKKKKNQVRTGRDAYFPSWLATTNNEV
jgi:hypothetical protein